MCKLIADDLADGFHVYEPNKKVLMDNFALVQNYLVKSVDGVVRTILITTSKEEQIIRKGTIVALISTDVEEVEEVAEMQRLVLRLSQFLYGHCHVFW